MIADIVGIPVEIAPGSSISRQDFLGSATPTARSRRSRRWRSGCACSSTRQELGRRKRESPRTTSGRSSPTSKIEGEDGERSKLSQTELDFFFLLLTIAGSETTRNAIALGLVALLDHPDQLDTLRRERSAMRPAVEEILRWSSPVAYFARRATRDTRDPRRTDRQGRARHVLVPVGEPGRRGVRRSPSASTSRDRPNPHVAFGGGGAHFCLGANLARREIAILFEELLARTREIEVLGRPRFSPLGIWNPILVAPKEIPVRLA